jgi:hypothetical protein
VHPDIMALTVRECVVMALWLCASGDLDGCGFSVVASVVDSCLSWVDWFSNESIETES